MMNNKHWTLFYNTSNSLNRQTGGLKLQIKLSALYLCISGVRSLDLTNYNEQYVSDWLTVSSYTIPGASLTLSASLEWSHLLLQECMLDWSTNCAANMLKLTAC